VDISLHAIFQQGNLGAAKGNDLASYKGFIMRIAKTWSAPGVLGLVFLLTYTVVVLSQGSPPAAKAAIPEAILLWDKGAPKATGDSLEDKPAVYPFLPEAAKNTGAAILVCPGGGNQTRCADFEGVLIAQWFRERGIAAFILRYRVGPLYTGAEARLDTQRGVQFLRANAEKFKIAPDRIGVIGFSAGASNICGAAYSALPGDPAASDPVERVSSSPNFMIPVYGSGFVPAETKSPLPPTFMFCTAEDGAINGMIAMYQSLRKKGVPTEVHFFEKGPHGTSFALGDPVLGEWPNLLYNWMRLKGFLTGETRVPVEGIVKLDGEPLPRGTIIFHPLDKVGANPVVGYVFNSTAGRPRGEFKVAASVGAVPGKYRVEVRQDATRWLSNAINPMTAKYGLLKTGTDAQKKEVADYARTRNLEPSIENQRVYRKIRPSDEGEIFVEVKGKGENRVDIEVFSK
jgi:acetyl esterase/lipase